MAKTYPKRKMYILPGITLVMCHLLFMFLANQGFHATSIGQIIFSAAHGLEFLSVLFSLQYLR